MYIVLWRPLDPPSAIVAGASVNKLAKRELAPNKGGPFAAALRSLAKNAGPDAKDGKCNACRCCFLLILYLYKEWWTLYKTYCK